ncbi:Pilus formation protein N terminal region [Cohaesibacter sp. ES.047]|uniref:pilus assembly protein N-terminal domain-containing protein n=1 Tax=Cohaesibacter sp. ES.047 TaxID=1798205 RepID=UPI000BB6D531|nr:pilus assembly protein N-terminal domain-containing protein [Cohaesibacter sp. ES.047]SNY91819.1 Pilus formation protein N terminal region [Cohaesibacter sp. ES.047]
MKVVSAVSALVLSVLLLGSSVASAQDYPMIDVKVDRAKVMRVSRPAAMIILGNPAIADATIKDSQTLIITGKQFGTTNLIVLDSDGEPIADELLRVSSATDSHVVIYKGTGRETMACSPYCEPVFRVGDNNDKLKALAGQITAYRDMANGEATNMQQEE